MKTDTSGADEPTRLLLADLGALALPDERQETLRLELRTRLVAEANRHSVNVRRRPGLPRRRRVRVGLAFGLATAIAVAVVAAVTLPGGTTTASAQTVLRRAAALRLGANEVTHFKYSVEMTLPGASSRTTAGSGEIWIQTDRQGAPTTVAETIRLSKNPSAPPVLIERAVQTSAGVYTYHSGNNAIIVPSRHDPSWAGRASPTIPLPAYLFDGATVAQKLSQLAHGAQGGVQLLTQRTLDGVTVDTVQVDGWPDGAAQRTLFYFDAQSHLLRGFDAVPVDPSYAAPSWQVRLAHTETMPASGAPAATFSLNAPASAFVELPLTQRALAQLCPENGKQLMLQGESMLEACRAKTPNLSVDALVAALASSARPDLDAAVAAGQITHAQEAAALAQQQAQLRSLVTAPPPVPPATGK